ncbi:MAG: electron transport complex subunit E [Deltaproteobacteria bacterium]|nr:electron transport complex subunit E [Deltaproteobacteria bacterium]
MSGISEITRGLWKENPVFRLLLGMCPTLATTTSCNFAVGMGLSALFVLVASNVAVAALRNVIPGKTRLPCFIVLIATFVTIVDLVLNAYVHNIHKALGIFIPLIVVNCIILGRAEAFASKRPVWDSFLDGLGMGLGFTFGLVCLATVREVLGNGTWFGFPVTPEGYQILVFVLPPGAFISLGFLIGAMNGIENWRKAHG